MNPETARKLLEDLGAERIRVRETSDGDYEVVCCCVLHVDGNPSASINPTKEIYNCYCCGGYSIPGLVMEFGNFNYGGALAWLEKYDLEGFEDYEQKKKIELREIPDYDQRLASIREPNLPERYFEEWGNSQSSYLRRRVPSQPVRAELGIHYDSDKKRIIFPVHNISGKIVGWSERWAFDIGRDEDGTIVLPSSAARVVDEEFDGDYDAWEISNPRWRHEYKKMFHVYGAHLLKPKKRRRLIVVEGFTTLAWMRSLGFEDVVALGGSKVSKYQADILMENADEIVAALDNDKAGHLGVQKLINRCSAMTPVYFVPWGQHEKDFDNLSKNRIVTLLNHVQYYLSSKFA